MYTCMYLVFPRWARCTYYSMKLSTSALSWIRECNMCIFKLFLHRPVHHNLSIHTDCNYIFMVCTFNHVLYVHDQMCVAEFKTWNRAPFSADNWWIWREIGLAWRVCLKGKVRCYQTDREIRRNFQLLRRVKYVFIKYFCNILWSSTWIKFCLLKTYPKCIRSFEYVLMSDYVIFLLCNCFVIYLYHKWPFLFLCTMLC